MKHNDAWDRLVYGYDLDLHMVADVLNAADWEFVQEIRVKYTDTVTLLVRKVGDNNFVVDETDA